MNNIENETNIEEEINPSRVKSCEQLLLEFKKRCELKGTPKGELIDFDTEKDISKITAPFQKGDTDIRNILAELTAYNLSPIVIDGQTHLLGRVESKSSEKDSEIALFEEVDGRWQLDAESPIYPGQDPFDCGIIQGEHVFGNVETWTDTDNPEITHYRTVFRRYRENLSEIVDGEGKITEPFAVGPEKMKDIRLVDLKNGKIGVFTRPQKENFGGLGKAGYLEISSLDELEAALAKYDQDEDQSSLIPDLCQDDEWVGVNQAILLEDGRIGVLGHIARFRKTEPDNPESPKVKDYFGMAFIFDPKTLKASNMKIIITADNFPAVEPKKADLGSVYFLGGINDSNQLYGSVGDVKGCGAEIEDPFSE